MSAAGPARDGEAAEPQALEVPSPWRTVLLAALVATCIVAVRALHPAELLQGAGIEDLRALLTRGEHALLIFTALTALGVAVGVPRILLAGAGGVLFGWLGGAALVQVGTLAGCWATFALARLLGRDYVAHRVSLGLPRTRALLEALGRHGFSAGLLVRVMPVGNCFATNLVLGISPVTLRQFLASTFLGTLPETLVYALFGSAAVGETALRVAVASTLLVALSVLSALGLRRLRARGAWPREA